MLSMTGYGRADYNEGGISLAVEIKTINNRNFDFNAKMPRSFIALEDCIRKTVQKFIVRGRIDLFINFADRREKNSLLQVDLNRAQEYYNASIQVAEKLGLENDCSVVNVLKFPNVLIDDCVDDVSNLEEVLTNLVCSACETLNVMRKIEGQKLVDDMLDRLNAISLTVEKITNRAPLVAKEYKQKLTQRIEDALKDVKYDEARLLNEVAFYTDRVNIDEELTRLKSHISQFKDIVKINGGGKKLDFLMQEFNREANTICSKSNDIEVTQLALSLKNDIEKIREQVQNLE